MARSSGAGRRLRPPAWLKRWLVPVWNAGVHSTRAWADRAAPVRGQVGRCEVCGRLGLLDLPPPRDPSRAGPPLGLVRASGPRRGPQGVVGVLAVRGQAPGAAARPRPARPLPGPTGGPGRSGRSPSGPDRAGEPAPGGRDQPGRRVARRLERPGRLRGVGLPGGSRAGGDVAGVRHEDLTRLTYPARPFDLVITSETLEHVPDLAAALAEIRRVLVPGGVHLFTVPLVPGHPRTFPRARRERRWGDRPPRPADRPPGGRHGWPVFTEFGADFPASSAQSGFEVEVRFGPTTEDDVAQVYIARKPRIRPTSAGSDQRAASGGSPGLDGRPWRCDACSPSERRRRARAVHVVDHHEAGGPGGWFPAVVTGRGCAGRRCAGGRRGRPTERASSKTPERDDGLATRGSRSPHDGRKPVVIDPGVRLAFPGVDGEEAPPLGILVEGQPIARAERPMWVPSSTTTLGRKCRTTS